MISVGTLSFKKKDNQIDKPFSQATAKIIDQEVQKLIKEAYDYTYELLSSKKVQSRVLLHERLLAQIANHQ